MPPREVFEIGSMSFVKLEEGRIPPVFLNPALAGRYSELKHAVGNPLCIIGVREGMRRLGGKTTIAFKVMTGDSSTPASERLTANAIFFNDMAAVLAAIKPLYPLSLS